MRRRIIRLSTAVTLVAIVLFGLPLAIGLTRYFTSEQHRQLHDLATRISIQVSGDQGLRQLPSDARTDPAHQYAVYDLTGATIAGGALPGSGSLARSALAGQVVDGRLGGRYAVALPVTDGNTVIGAVLVSQPDPPISGTVAAIWAGMATLAVISLTISWLFGRRQVRVLTKPLEDLATIAERLGSGDLGVRTTAVGIAEIDSVNRSINRTAARLGALLDRERAYTADASHQLRTPLTGLRLQLEAALDDQGSDPRNAILAALLTADRLEHTITDLLALARDTPSNDGPLDVEAVMSDVKERWTGPLTRHSRPIRTTIECTEHISHASPAAVTQILDVLVDNAYHHGRGEVRVTARDAIDAVAIDVTNEGPAITTDTQLLFRRRSSGAANHGIGLSLARNLAEAEGGRLTLTARTPTFTLLLPKVARDESHSEAG